MIYAPFVKLFFLSLKEGWRSIQNVRRVPRTPLGKKDMERKAADILRLSVLIALLLFFGTGLMIVTSRTAATAARWAFDILSALLFILIFYWLLAQDESLNRGN
jgi:hypothetical protein